MGLASAEKDRRGIAHLPVGYVPPHFSPGAGFARNLSSRQSEVRTLGLTDYFSKEGRKARSLQKMIQRAGDKHAQSPDRFRALELLRDDGGSEAILGLLRRFGFVYDKTIEDEQEKEWVFHELVAMGPKVLPPLRKYMRESETLGWALKILEQVARGEEFQKVLEQLCEQNDNNYVRDPNKKIQLVHFMGEHREPTIAKLLIPYLEDIDEGVRFKAVQALLHQAQPDVVVEPLCKLLLRPTEESRRIKIRILEGFAEAQFAFSQKDRAAIVQVAKDLDIPISLDEKGRLKQNS